MKRLLAMLLICNLVMANGKALLLRRYPMLYAHNAGTGYIRKNIFNDFVKNQVGSLTDQLNCGARAFDVRPERLEDGRVYFHHGGITLYDILFKNAMKEVVEWANRNRNLNNDLVLLIVQHCLGDGCTTATKEILQDLDVPYLDECNELIDLTYEGAKNKGRLPGGGAILAISGCIDDNYNPQVRCYHAPTWYGRRERRILFPKCIEGDKETFELLYNDLKAVTSTEPSESEGKLVVANAHWQYDQGSIVAGLLEKSSILEDVEKSGINEWTAQKISQGEFPHINLLQVNYVCYQSQQVVQALESYAFAKGIFTLFPTFSPTSSPSSSPTMSPTVASTLPIRIAGDSTCKPMSGGGIQSIEANTLCALPFTYKYRLSNGKKIEKQFFTCPTLAQARPFRASKALMSNNEDQSHLRWCVPRPEDWTESEETIYNPQAVNKRDKWVLCQGCTQSFAIEFPTCPSRKAILKCPKLDNQGRCQKNAKCIWHKQSQTCETRTDILTTEVLLWEFCFDRAQPGNTNSSQLKCRKPRKICKGYDTRWKCNIKAKTLGCVWCENRCR